MTGDGLLIAKNRLETGTLVRYIAEVQIKSDCICEAKMPKIYLKTGYVAGRGQNFLELERLIR